MVILRSNHHKPKIFAKLNIYWEKALDNSCSVNNKCSQVFVRLSGCKRPLLYLIMMPPSKPWNVIKNFCHSKFRMKESIQMFSNSTNSLTSWIQDIQTRFFRIRIDVFIKGGLVWWIAWQTYHWHNIKINFDSSILRYESQLYSTTCLNKVHRKLNIRLARIVENVKKARRLLLEMQKLFPRFL